MLQAEINQEDISKYRLIKHQNNNRFAYNSIEFSQHSFHIFAGLNAVDNLENVTKIFQTLNQHDLQCARMGAFKPRTSPYSFQGWGDKCLPYVFELAGNYNIKVIAMEITHESQIELIEQQLELAGWPTGVMLQIGTRNAQNFELLKFVGKQKKFPVLYKRGFGITLEESLMATEYIASAGNQNIIFCLRGVKSLFSESHRNMVDFSQVPIIQKKTKLPVCIDPSHAVGHTKYCPKNISDIFHVSAQGIIAGANMLLIDIHPNPPLSLVDANQAISLDKLPWLIEDAKIARQAYLDRCKLVKQYEPQSI